MTKAEAEFDSWEPIASETSRVLKQMEQVESWNDAVLPKHEQLEKLNWVAGQLTSAAGIVDG